LLKGTNENACKSETRAKSGRTSSTATTSKKNIEEKQGENDLVPCKICKKEMTKKSLGRHIGQSKICKELYGKEFDNMKAEKKRQIDLDYYKKNAKSIKVKQTVYNSQNRDKINTRQKGYDSQHREEINTRQTAYNIEHREEIKGKQKIRRTKKQMNMTAEDRIKAFRKDIIEGPNFTCFSCKRCLFKNSVRIIKSKDLPKVLESLDPKILQRIGLKKNRLRKNAWQVDLIVCHNCLKLIRKGNVPKIHHSNGLWLDKVPEELELKDLEQQLIARTLLFMKVKRLPTTRMKAMFDQVISVPIEQDDVSRTVSELPRHPDDAKIVAVKLKRKLEYRNTHIEEFIRPSKCIKAVEKLKEMGNPFYQDVNVNETFMEREEVSFIKLLFYIMFNYVAFHTFFCFISD
jgi:hypothetical protein